MRKLLLTLGCLLLLIGLPGCSAVQELFGDARPQTPAEKVVAAKAGYDEVVKAFTEAARLNKLTLKQANTFEAVRATARAELDKALRAQLSGDQDLMGSYAEIALGAVQSLRAILAQQGRT